MGILPSLLIWGMKSFKMLSPMNRKSTSMSNTATVMFISLLSSKDIRMGKKV